MHCNADMDNSASIQEYKKNSTARTVYEHEVLATSSNKWDGLINKHGIITKPYTKILYSVVTKIYWVYFILKALRPHTVLDRDDFPLS